MKLLETAVYTAYRGYAWSRTPDGLSVSGLEALYRLASAGRSDFPSPTEVTCGVVSDGSVAAAFTIRSVPNWDAEGRAADYAAFAFVPCAEAGEIDFRALLATPFFAQPERTPPATLAYEGPAAANPPLDAPGHLLCKRRLTTLDPSAIGVLLKTYAPRCDRWSFKLNDTMDNAAVETGAWRLGKLATPDGKAG